MAGIFVSYRRAETEGQAGRLHDDLVRAFGKDMVWMDVLGIQYGADFRETIEERLSGTSVMLAVIGRSWLDTRNAEGGRRIDEPTDLVRIETVTALKRKLPLIPVLVGGATMPSESDLPDELKPLVFKHAIELRHDKWASDVALLVKQLRRHVAAARRPRIRTYAQAAVVAAAAVVGLAIWLRSTSAPERSAVAPEPVAPSLIPAASSNAGASPNLRAEVSSPPASSVEWGTVMPKAEPDSALVRQTRNEALAASLSAEAVGKLDDLVQKLKEPGFTLELVLAVGHSDPSEDADASERISGRRADAVKAYVVSHGIDSKLVQTERKGKRFPVADSSTEQSRSRNRRVEVAAVGTRMKEAKLGKVTYSADIFFSSGN